MTFKKKATIAFMVFSLGLNFIAGAFLFWFVRFVYYLERFQNKYTAFQRFADKLQIYFKTVPLVSVFCVGVAVGLGIMIVWDMAGKEDG